MSAPRHLLVLTCVVVAVLSAPACIRLPDIEPAQAQVRITAPEGTAFTNGVVEVRLEVTGHPADRVELLKDGEVLAELGPPYTYAWDTSGEAEGTYRLEARAVLGDAVFASEVREVVVDRTPPRVVSRTPEPGAEDVWVRSPIQAVFSEPVKVGTVPPESVRLTVGTVEVARTVSLSGDGRTLTVEPGTGYAPSNVVSLAFTASLSDFAGNNVAVSEPWSWTLPYWISWGTSNGAPVTNHNDRMTSYAFDNSGTLIANWLVFGGAGYSLYTKRWEGGEWKIYRQLLASDSGNSPIHTNSLLLDENGNPIVAWSQTVAPNTSRIVVKRWTGDSWETLGGYPGATSGLPQKRQLSLQWGPSGQPTIVWSESDNSQTRICIGQWNSREWVPIGDCMDARTAADYDTNPRLRFTRDGVPIVSWISNQATYHDIYTSRYIDSEWMLLEGDRSSDVQGAYVSMESDTTGSPMAAWLHRNENNYNLIVDRWSGTAWQPMGQPLNLGHGATSAAGHSLQVDSAGTPLIAWTGSRVHVHRWTGESWQGLDDSSNTEAYGTTGSGSLHRTNSGEVVLTWFRDTGTDTRIRTRRVNR